MKLQVKNSPTNTEIHIDDNIKSLGDSDAIEDETKPIDLFINDSFIITSLVIGFLIKFIQKDKMKIYNAELYEMLDNMSLVQALNVKKV